MLSQLTENKIRKLIKKVLFKEYITPRDLKSVENYADDLFSDVGVEVEFTRHFLDRVNDLRNKKDITPEELKLLYQKAYDKYSNRISKLPPGKEAVLSDLDTQINIPFAMNWDGKSPNIDMVGKTVMRKKDFKSYNPKLTLENEGLNSKIKLKNILDFPSELSDIFDICKNEIELGGDVQLYSKIYADCLMTYHNLTYGNVDIINKVRDSIKKSNDSNEVRHQYKSITNPKHIIPSVLLRMLNDYKDLKFVSEKLKNFRVIDSIIKLVSSKITGEVYLSKNFMRELLNGEVEINSTMSEDINVPINVGDEVLGGKFKNKKVIVKSIDKNEKGDITINDKPLLRFRITKKK